MNFIIMNDRIILIYLLSFFLLFSTGIVPEFTVFFSTSPVRNSTENHLQFEKLIHYKQSAEQLNEYLRNVNQTDTRTKSKNVFRLAPPSSSLSSTQSTNVFDSTVFRPLSLDDYDSLVSVDVLIGSRS